MGCLFRSGELFYFVFLKIVVMPRILKTLAAASSAVQPFLLSRMHAALNEPKLPTGATASSTFSFSFPHVVRPPLQPTALLPLLHQRHCHCLLPSLTAAPGTGQSRDKEDCRASLHTTRSPTSTPLPSHWSPSVEGNDKFHKTHYFKLDVLPKFSCEFSVLHL